MPRRPSEQPAVVAVVVAGGTGERFGLTGGKQLAVVHGLPVLAHTLKAFDEARSISAIVLVTHPDRIEEYRDRAITPISPSKPVTVVAGGSTRQESVRNGIAAVPDDAAAIAVHDGARPMVTPEVIDEAVTLVVGGVDGVVVGHESYDTLKVVDGGSVVETPDRSRYWVAQTPQVFRAGLLRTAYVEAERNGRTGTDDASLVEAIGGHVRMLEGPRTNIKVTVAEDLEIVDALLGMREGSE